MNTKYVLAGSKHEQREGATHRASLSHESRGVILGYTVPSSMFFGLGPIIEFLDVHVLN
jgi:hypothetical protein